jgi:hypothetical protein
MIKMILTMMMRITAKVSTIKANRKKMMIVKKKKISRYQRKSKSIVISKVYIKKYRKVKPR